MAAFSQQHPSLQIDSVLPPNSPLKNSGFLDEFFPNWNQFFNSSGHTTLPLPHLEGSSINDASNHESSCLEQQSINNELSMTEKQSFSSMADRAESGEQVSQICSPVDKKRKSRHGSSSNSANSKDVKHAKGKKQKGDKEAKKDDKNDKKDQNKANVEEPPKGYIHVRARRGQATDSHSLAERVRREKISERMKMLQALVPGCDKVTGKALMLDEIINYVQSLQTQVEFLSMRLASLDPMVYNFGLMDHLDPILPFANQEFINNNNSMVLSMPPTQTDATTVVATSNGTSQPMNFANVSASTTSMTSGGNADQPPNFINTNAITTTTTAATIASTAFPSPHVIDSSANLLQLGQKPSVLPIQDDIYRSLYWGSGVEDHQHRLSFFNF